ncbi:MAG TPA: alpha/beta fold hydrolase [Burkholderiaceae bacterium]|nr:alpha/beta fold hydrolase [Burkholderiaceae bacterium]
MAVLCGQAISHTEETIRLHTSTCPIEGTVSLPESTGPVPVALIIAGSGPTDRDGNSLGLSGRNNSLRMLADALANAGIVSLRYDKRGVAASRCSGRIESDLRFEDYAADAAAWVGLLKQDRRLSGIAIVGHSEGALVGLLATRQSAVAAYVSIAGASEGASRMIRRQLKGRLPAELAGLNEQILSSLETGKSWPDVPAQLTAIYRPSVQAYLMSWFRYVPTNEIAELTAPCLILQGDTDIQVSMSDAKALHEAHPSCKLKLVVGMNHVMKIVPTDSARQMASDSDPALPLAPELVHTLTSFLKTSRNATAEPSRK